MMTVEQLATEMRALRERVEDLEDIAAITPHARAKAKSLIEAHTSNSLHYNELDDLPNCLVKAGLIVRPANVFAHPYLSSAGKNIIQEIGDEAGAIAFAGVIAEMGKKVYEVAQNFFLLKDGPGDGGTWQIIKWVLRGESMTRLRRLMEEEVSAPQLLRDHFCLLSPPRCGIC